MKAWIRQARVPAALILIALTCSALAAQVLHVSPTGTDRNPGTREQPLSLQAAITRASADMGIKEIVLAGGEYLAENVNTRNPVGE
ncbi:MAG: hypothetical protein FJ279_12615, partial [Planctomycetes bacterium]|nr:hypothetical protein [Planctomycetota bacterium]